MRVLVADKFEQSGIDGLRAAGCEVMYQPDLKDSSLVDAIRDTGADVVVVRSTPVTARMLEAGTLSLVVRAGAGYNTIDVAAASKRGIYVSNCPGKNSIAVAELALGLMLALDRRIPDNVVELRAGRWKKKEFSQAKGLYGRTLGLLGFGNIGQEVARRAQAFGLNLVVWSRRFADVAPLDDARGLLRLDQIPSQARVSLARTPEEVSGQCDILSIHLALAPGTHKIVNRAVLSRLKPGAYVVNTSRGEVVDHDAIQAMVEEKKIRVGLDVYAAEPAGSVGEFSDPIVSLPGVYGTHHIGASTEQAQEAIAAETVRIIRSYKETGKVPNVVNLCARTPATHMLVVRHLDRPGVLAHVFEHVRAANLNVQETENTIFEGAQAAVARINLDGEPSVATLTAIGSGNRDILDLHLVKL